jgi:UDP-glucose 4-epimerase
MKNSLNTLIIDGAGYTEAHAVPRLVPLLAQQLVATGRLVTILSKSTTYQSELPDGVNYVVGDFSKHSLISRLLDTHQEVIHLAYAVEPKTSLENPLSELLQNLPQTAQLFSEAAVRGVRLLLLSTGGMIYGEASELPIRETHTTKPISFYGVTKLTMENYANLYAAIHGLKFVCVRIANAYGEGQRPFCGQGFIPTAIASALKGMPIKIFGQHGTIRDYIYVTDLASGIVHALERGHLSETYNLGSGIGMSNLDVIEVLKPLLHEVGCEVQVENLPESACDVKANVLDSTKLQVHTGWQQKVKFEVGMKRTCGWLRTIVT